VKFVLIALLSCLLTAYGMAHGIIRNELWIQRDGEHVRVRVAATLDEILLAQDLHPDDDRAIAVDTLKGAIDRHAAYMAKHVAMTAPDGTVINFTSTGFKIAEKLAAQILPPTGSAEGAAATTVTPSQISPETTRVSYEFEAELPDALRNQPLNLTHSTLSDIPAAYGTTFVVYKARVQTGDEPIVSLQLRKDDSLTVAAPSTAATAAGPADPSKGDSVSPSKRPFPWLLTLIVFGLPIAMVFLIKLRLKA